MRVELKTDLFSNEQYLRDVSYLLNIFNDNGRYEYLCDIYEIKDTPVFNELMAIDKKAIEEHYIQFIQASSTADYSISENEENCFNLEEGKRFFNQQVLIILENSLNDSYFVNRLINVFDKKSNTIKNHLNETWLRYENAGGCGNIKNTIDGLKNQYNNLPKNNHQYLRCFVLIDSDKKYAEDKTTSRNDLINYLSENNVPFHILEKREMENYLPIEILKDSEIDKDFIGHLETLSPIQRDYFDLEKGFGNKNRRQLLQPIKDFYDSITDDTYNGLRRGSNIRNFKSTFPQLFNNVTKEQFIQITEHQDDPKELENLLSRITEIL